MVKSKANSKNFQLFQNTGQFSATTFKNGYEYKLFILPDSQLSWREQYINPCKHK